MWAGLVRFRIGTGGEPSGSMNAGKLSSGNTTGGLSTSVHLRSQLFR
jgi:hypothetical protein